MFSQMIGEVSIGEGLLVVVMVADAIVLVLMVSEAIGRLLEEESASKRDARKGVLWVV